MKNLLLALLIPCAGFACQCQDVLKEQKELIEGQILSIEESYINGDDTLMYLLGQYAAYDQAIFLLQITGNCP